MDLQDKLRILTDAAKYDVACTSSGNDRPGNGGLGSAVAGGICHAWAADGRCVSLLKVLMTNVCKYDCAYCVNRRSNDRPRASFTPQELIELTMQFYRRNYIEGLFLSSGVAVSPQDTMERFLAILRALREEHGFNGYIHVKAIPGADDALLEAVGRYADRMSVNIEMPSQQSLDRLAPDKSRNSIVRPMRYISSRIAQGREEGMILRSAPRFVPAGQSTQMVIGATPDTDHRILTLSEALYKQYRLKRVFYSAYVPLNEDARLPALPQPPLLREHRLYQSDFLLRFYGFAADEILDEAHPFLDPQLDPKANWALRHLDRFPVEVNRAPREMLLRVPGIGVKGTARILQARTTAKLRYEDLVKLGIVMKRARYFLLMDGRYFGGVQHEPDLLHSALTSIERQSTPGLFMQQMGFLEQFPQLQAPVEDPLGLAAFAAG